MLDSFQEKLKFRPAAELIELTITIVPQDFL